MASTWIFIGSVSGFLGVALGAFGAHALADKLDARALQVYQTAVHYQFVHAVALLFVGLYLRTLGSQPGAGPAQVAGWTFTIGTVLFSGSLYALAISGVKILGAITPFGGLSFLAGWVALALSASQAWQK